MSENPLQNYFRQPAIYLEIPSKGKFYTDEFEPHESNEVPVYPMTAKDEIAYKTPDALFNGTATVDVIKSCVPSFVDPWRMLTFDLNTILIAIRIASGGEKLTIPSECPKCKEVMDYEFDLTTLIDSKPDITPYDTPLSLGDLQIYFKPITYKEANENNLLRFEEQRLTDLLTSDNISEPERVKLLSEAFRNIAEFSLKAIQSAVRSIHLPETVVEDPKFIEEFLSNCDQITYNEIKKRIIELREIEALKPFTIVCGNEECKHQYKQPYTFDMTTFFDLSS